MKLIRKLFIKLVQDDILSSVRIWIKPSVARFHPKNKL